MKITCAVFCLAGVLSGQEAGWRIDQNEQEFTAVRAAYLRAQRRAGAGAQSEALLKEALGHLAAGRTGEARRKFHQGMTLLRGQQWTALEEYAASLVLRGAFTVFDPSWPFAIHLSQVFPVELSFSREPRVRLSIHSAAPLPQGATRLGAKLRDLGIHSGISSDLIAEPLRLEASLTGLADGLYGLVVELLDGDTPVCTLVKSIYAVRGLAAAREEIEQRLGGIEDHAGLKATIRYPFDFARRLNNGLREQRHENMAALVARSRALAQGLAEGRDPLEGATGDLRRHHYLKEAGAILPYRLFVPPAYDGRPLPLVVALHGSGGSENTMMDRDGALLKTLAERHSFIAVSPLGYRPNSNYGLGQSREQSGIPVLMRTAVLAERDVLHVVDLVRREYKVDPRRIYLLGHSGGGGGTWVLGVNHPEIWAALAPIASGFTAADFLDLTRVKNIPVLIAHGDKDDVAPIASSREMAARLKQAGGAPRFVELPGANHDSAVAAALPQIFEFFRTITR